MSYKILEVDFKAKPSCLPLTAARTTTNIKCRSNYMQPLPQSPTLQPAACSSSNITESTNLIS